MFFKPIFTLLALLGVAAASASTYFHGTVKLQNDLKSWRARIDYGCCDHYPFSEDDLRFQTKKGSLEAKVGKTEQKTVSFSCPDGQQVCSVTKIRYMPTWTKIGNTAMESLQIKTWNDGKGNYRATDISN